MMMMMMMMIIIILEKFASVWCDGVILVNLGVVYERIN